MSQGIDRRNAMRSAGLLAAVAAANTSSLFAADNDETIKVGLIGAGGRGSGAIEDCLDADPKLKLVAIGDAFADRANGCLGRLKKSQKYGPMVDVPAEKVFVGLDAYQKVIDAGVDLVILATPPGFRPLHLEAAVKAGKHIFTEKPVAVDGPGIRRVMAAHKESLDKKICIVAGTQRRHQAGYLETIAKIHDGAIGELTSGRCYWNQGGLWKRDKGTMKDLEWQIRNWLYFVWLSGDHIVEQHVHNLDVMNWVLKGHPKRVVAMGGRQVRTDPAYGHIFDHFSCEYEYANGVIVQSFARQIDGCENSVSEAIVGTKGKSQLNAYTINGKSARTTTNNVNPYKQEHIDLIAAIRKGEKLNELETVAESTLTAIMGRMSAYTGKAVSWEDAYNSQEVTMPKELNWDMTLPVPPVAVPGSSKSA